MCTRSHPLTPTQEHWSSSPPLADNKQIVPLINQHHQHTKKLWLLPLKKKKKKHLDLFPLYLHFLITSFLSNPLLEISYKSCLNSWLQCLATHSLQSGFHSVWNHSYQDHKLPSTSINSVVSFYLFPVIWRLISPGIPEIPSSADFWLQPESLWFSFPLLLSLLYGSLINSPTYNNLMSGPGAQPMSNINILKESMNQSISQRMYWKPAKVGWEMDLRSMVLFFFSSQICLLWEYSIKGEK